MKINISNIFKFIISIISFLYLCNTFNKYFNHDEFEAIHASWLTYQGLLIYVDYFQHHHPLIYFTFATFFTLVEGIASLYIFRFFIFTLSIGIVFLTYKIARIYLDRTFSYLSSIFLMTSIHFYESALVIRPDIPYFFFMMLGVYSYLLLVNHSQKKYLPYVIGLFFSVAFMFLQKAVFPIATIGILSIYHLMKNKISVSDFVKCLVSFIFSTIIFYTLLLKYVPLENYIFYNWIINLKWDFSFSIIIGIRRLIEINFPILLFFMLSLNIPNIIKSRLFDVYIITIFLTIFLFSVRTPFSQYWMVIYPFISIICASFFSFVSNKLDDKSIIITVILSIFYPTSYIIRDISRSNKEQIKKIQYVIENSNDNDLVYDGDARFNLFRKDLDFYYFSVGSSKGLNAERSVRSYNYDIYELISRKKPKIISTFMIDNLNHPTIKNNYIKSEKFDDLYLLKN